MKTVKVTKTDQNGNMVVAESQVPSFKDRVETVRRLTGDPTATLKKNPHLKK